MNLKLKIPFEALYILWNLKQKGFQGYIVGGAVRDLLIQAMEGLQKNKDKTDQQISVHDFDFTTNATPSQIQKLFSNSYYTNEFGTVGIAYDQLLGQMVGGGFLLPNNNIKTRFVKDQQKPADKIIDLAQASKIHHSLKSQVKSYLRKQKEDDSRLPPFEITTFRSEGLYSDFRRPDQIEWGQSIAQDLERRDFTINAMAITINIKHLESIFQKKQTLPSLISLNSAEYKLVDEHKGFKDLAKKQIVTVGSPDNRFQEDALRMLRAIRLACQLEFKIGQLTLSSIKDHAHLISKISQERISQEFLAILTTNQPDRGIRMLHETNLLQYIVPELTKGLGVEQGGHHDTDVWTHQLDAVKHCPSKDPIVRLATLLHDVGKPSTAKIKDGEITFYNHEIVSSRTADQIAQRLKLSTDQREKLFKLIRYHMFHYQPHQSDAAIRRLIKRVGLEYIDDILAVREGDRLGSGARKTSWRLEELKQRIIEQLNQPFDVTDLAIDGNDLINELKLQPGPKIGEILNQLTELVLEKPELNKKNLLLTEAKKIA
jgi:tRNA nucleotidyltransferase/poly(A) polymerase